MEGWRQRRLGSRAGTHREKEKNKNILTGKKKRKNLLDTHRPSHGRSWVSGLASTTDIITRILEVCAWMDMTCSEGVFD
jgi:hypothetical protein